MSGPDVERLLTELGRLQVYRGQRSEREAKVPAPHKPLLLFVVFRRIVVEGGPRLISFAALEQELMDLLAHHGRGKTLHPEYPFVRLATSPWLWETTMPTSAGELTADPSPAYLREHRIEGGLTTQATAALTQPGTLGVATRLILNTYFADLDTPQRWELLQRVGLDAAALG